MSEARQEPARYPRSQRPFMSLFGLDAMSAHDALRDWRRSIVCLAPEFISGLRGSYAPSERQRPQLPQPVCDGVSLSSF